MKIYQNSLKQFEKGFIGFCTLGVLGLSCIGSIAAMLILKSGTDFFEMFQLFIIVASCMSFNGAVLAQQKPKIIFNILIWTLSVSIFLIIYNM